jgi:hypothetical protein
MRFKSVTHGLLLGTEVRAELVGAKGRNPVVSGARILDDCLGGFDLADPENVGTTLLIDGADFSFLLPERADGEFTTIRSLIRIYERGGRGSGGASDVVMDRYRKFFTAVAALMTDLIETSKARVAFAA